LRVGRCWRNILAAVPPPIVPSSPHPATELVAGRPTRTALVGSGFIADVHLQVLRGMPGVRVVALCDPARARAERLAAKHRVPAVYQDLEAMLAAGGVDAVHLLVPPALHGPLAERCLRAGLHVLVEKPLVLTSAEVAPLVELATAQRRVLAVNHNQTCHPSLLALQDHLARGRLGRLEHLTLQHHVPLRQLGTGDVGHFMFQTAANIVWEQGVHLFSMVYTLLGECRAARALTGPSRVLGNGVPFVAEWLVALECARGTAVVRMAFGKPWLETTVQAIGSDGAAWLDLARGACWLRRKTRWLDFLDQGLNLASGALHLGSRAMGSVLGYGLGLFGLRFPDDPFLRSMRAAVQSFHRAVRGQGELAPGLAPAAAAAVLAMCEQTAAAAQASTSPPPAPPQPPPPGPPRPGEVLVLGGTGFLGRRCVQQLRAAGRPVSLVVRRPQLLPEELRAADLRLFVGDAADPAVLQRACTGAETVLHLATAAGDDPSQVEATMARAVAAAADACRAAGCRRLVYTSSTAALWLGAAGTIDGSNGPDPLPAQRSAYARGKIAAEAELRARRGQGLAITIVRPAIVVGPGGSPEHSGVGLWVRDNHCVGWGRGDLPLPLVLADDCATALVAALHAPAAADRDYNLAGSVRPTAREYVEALAVRTARDYRFHPMPLRWMWLQEFGKYLVKVAARRPREWPALRDFQSRSFRTELRCDDAVRDLGFRPEAERARFFARAFAGLPVP
jgi:predicted dehydrogenase/nucleoside-diphosphate-sugar epimerase